VGLELLALDERAIAMQCLLNFGGNGWIHGFVCAQRLS
jgi:hypothetical protein